MTMKCPVCGSDAMFREIRDLPHTYKGETTTIPGVEADFCETCDEAVVVEAAAARCRAAMLSFNK